MGFETNISDFIWVFGYESNLLWPNSELNRAYSTYNPSMQSSHVQTSSCVSGISYNLSINHRYIFSRY